MQFQGNRFDALRTRCRAASRRTWKVTPDLAEGPQATRALTSALWTWRAQWPVFADQWGTRDCLNADVAGIAAWICSGRGECGHRQKSTFYGENVHKKCRHARAYCVSGPRTAANLTGRRRCSMRWARAGEGFAVSGKPIRCPTNPMSGGLSAHMESDT